MAEIEEKIIVTDEDTANEDANENGSIYPYDLSDTVINMVETSFSVYEYLRKFKKGDINTSPDFQRKLVWTKEKKSKFIESIILNFPIPAIYLNETIDGKYIVIDGLQRTTALHDFYSSEFALNRLEALPKLVGKKFDDLAPAMQAKFEDKKLNIYNLKPSTPMPVIYDLFNRINTGGTQLNKQEVRNCIFIGKSTRLLKELSEQKYFIDAIDGGIADTRMKDRETILRYIAFRWFDYKTYYYSSNMSDYVEMAMKIINTMDGSDIDKIKIDFKRVMEWSFIIWGKQNFRIPVEEKRGTINSSILETVCNYLSGKNDDFLEQNLQKIKDNYITLINNKIFYDAVTRATGNKTKVIERFRLANEILSQNIITELSIPNILPDESSDIDKIQKQIDALLIRKNSLQPPIDNPNEKRIESELSSRNEIATRKITDADREAIKNWAFTHRSTAERGDWTKFIKKLGLTNGQAHPILDTFIK